MHILSLFYFICIEIYLKKIIERSKQEIKKKRKYMWYIYRIIKKIKSTKENGMNESNLLRVNIALYSVLLGWVSFFSECCLNHFDTLYTFFVRKNVHHFWSYRSYYIFFLFFPFSSD